jgi:hypothetical protein
MSFKAGGKPSSQLAGNSGLRWKEEGNGGVGLSSHWLADVAERNHWASDYVIFQAFISWPATLAALVILVHVMWFLVGQNDIGTGLLVVSRLLLVMLITQTASYPNHYIIDTIQVSPK